jgi:hypothetical protein
MSLEATIAENTAALRELIAAIKAGVPTTAAQVAAVVEQATDKPTTPAKAEAPEAAKPTTKAKNTQAAATAPAPQPSTATDAGASTDAAAPAPTYQDAAAAVTNLAKTKGRDAAVAVLTKFGAAKLPDVKPEQFADVIAACAEAVEA